MAAARALFWLALTAWVGAVLFFSLVVAPSVFGALPSESAGAVVAVVFRRYYVWGQVAGLVALLTAAIAWRAGAPSAAGAAITVMVAVMLGATAYAGWVVQPRVQALRPALHLPVVEPPVRAEFDRLHRRAVQLNAVVLLLGVVTICLAAARQSPPPRPRPERAPGAG
jgi:uncharacterized membrane protein